MNYYIREDYTPRLENDYSDERGQTDSCQDDVYSAAAELAKQQGLQSVLDVGCGGGFKLLKYFRHLRTLGIDLPPNLDFCRETYPDREWSGLDIFAETVPGFDLLIASDIIEHIVDPDKLCEFIKRCSPKFAVISTPNRDNLQEWSWPGPPRNLSHVREWSAPEFRQYMDSHFEVIEHIFPNARVRDRSTMWVVVKCR